MLTNLVMLIWFANSVYKLTKRNDFNAIQASHVIPAARIGGVSIILALALASLPFLETLNNVPYYKFLLISVFPVFVIGLCEDLGFLLGPQKRLLAAAISGVVFISLTGQWITRTDIIGLDFLMQWAPFGIGFSLFLAVGVSHSFNLIDGLNGLSGLTAVGVAISLAVLSHRMGLVEHRDILLFTCSAIAGFLVFNFPFGKIFLGDAGAYMIGHILIWEAISILYASPDISPFAILLIFFWPVADTLLAISRRMYLGVPIAHPDRLHFHQLVMRGVEILILGRKRRHISNPLATTLMLPLIFAPMIIGVVLALKKGEAIVAFIGFSVLFISAYKICILLTPKFRNFN